MLAKFVSTKTPPELPDNFRERREAEALSIAFAVVGKMIGEGWINVDFTEQGWPVELRLQVQTVAEVLYDYQ